MIVERRRMLFFVPASAWGTLSAVMDDAFGPLSQNP
jgi:hypothetical protein